MRRGHHAPFTSANRRLSSTSRIAGTTERSRTASPETTILGLTRSVVASQKEIQSGSGSMARRCTPRHEPACGLSACGPGGAVRPSARVAGRPVGSGAAGRRPVAPDRRGTAPRAEQPRPVSRARGATFRERGGARCSLSVVDARDSRHERLARRSTADSARCADPPTWRGCGGASADLVDHRGLRDARHDRHGRSGEGGLRPAPHPARPIGVPPCSIAW